jgi:hypothetical protein
VCRKEIEKENSSVCLPFERVIVERGRKREREGHKRMGKKAENLWPEKI